MRDDRPQPGDAELLETSPFGDAPDETPAPARKPPGATLLLVAALLVVAGFAGGIYVQKWRSDGDTASGPRQGAAGYGRMGGGGGPQGGPFGGGGGGGQRGGTMGTVTAVKGDVLTLRTPTGETVQVRIGEDATVNVTKKGTAKDLKTGTSLVVRGTPGSDGTIAATTVTQSDQAFNGRRMGQQPGQ